MFPQNGVLISILEVKKRSNQNCQRDRSTTEREYPLNELTRSSKHPPANDHPTLPPVELIKRNYVSNHEREIERAKQRAPGQNSEHKIYADTRSKHKQLLQQRPTLQGTHVHLHVRADRKQSHLTINLADANTVKLRSPTESRLFDWNSTQARGEVVT